MGLVILERPEALEKAESFLGPQNYPWRSIHVYFSIAFVALVILYLILSWIWMRSKAPRLLLKGRAARLVLVVVVSLFVLSLFWARYSNAPETHEHYGVRAGSRGKAVAIEKTPYGQEESISIERGKESIVITTQMTLLNVEKATGIPAKDIADALGLPSNVMLNERLGQLRKGYPFALQEVEDVLTELLDKKESLHQARKEGEAPTRQEPDIQIKEAVKPREPLHEGHKQRFVRGRLAAVPSGILITGRMTFHDLEDITGIPARKIADELALPSNAPLYEHLGRLRKSYLFSMQDVRDAVASLMKKSGKEG